MFLVETHVGYNKAVCIDGYHYYLVCRPVSKTGRHFGELAILSRRAIKPYVSILSNTCKEFQWIKLDKDYFFLIKDLYICLVYMPPVNSKYTQGLNLDVFELIEKDIISFKSKGDIMLCGDFNARTWSCLDFINNDNADHLPLYKNYCTDHKVEARNNMDTTSDTRGKDLIELCIGNELRILSGRVLGDIYGNFTCFTPNGTSVVDFVIVSHSILDRILNFKISDFLGTLSDCHCKLSWSITAKYDVDQTNSTGDSMPVKYIWDDKSPELFQTALLSNPIKIQVNKLLKKDMVGIDLSAMYLSKIFIEAAEVSLNKKRAIKECGKPRKKKEMV